MGIFMVEDNLKDMESLKGDQQDIDDLYYETFRLLQDELEKTVDRYPYAAPTEHVISILGATDMFYRKNYGTQKSTDRTGTSEL